MKDATIIFLTVNKVPEKWRQFHREKLLEAAGDFPIITVSAKPMLDMPGINIIQEPPFNSSNVYRQMLRAAKIANTPYIMIAEDDSLYSREHFTKFRPKPQEFAYNLSRWGIMSWGEPTYFWCDRISNLTLIAPRELVIKSLEERFEKYPDGTPDGLTGELGRYKSQRDLGVTPYPAVAFYTTIPVVNFSHPNALCPLEQSQQKRRGFVRAYDIPEWGHAKNLIKYWV